MAKEQVTDALQGSAILDQLYAVIQSRSDADPADSWTARLIKKGLPKICQKVGEEATETIVAALAESQEDLLEESADLLYHLLVLWSVKGVQPDDVYKVLYQRRIGDGDRKKTKRNKGN